MIEIDCVKWRTRRWAAGNCASTGQGCCSQVLLSRPNSILTLSLLAVLIVNILILIDRKYLHKCANLSVPIHVAAHHHLAALSMKRRPRGVLFAVAFVAFAHLFCNYKGFAPSEPRCSPPPLTVSFIIRYSFPYGGKNFQLAYRVCQVSVQLSKLQAKCLSSGPILRTDSTIFLLQFRARWYYQQMLHPWRVFWWNEVSSSHQLNPPSDRCHSQ